VKNNSKFKSVLNRGTVLGFAAVYAVMAIIGSTFSWVTSSDTRVNQFRGEISFGATVSENFTSNLAWRPNTADTKVARVTNTEKSPAFVRVSLAEAMQSYGLSDTNGNITNGANAATLLNYNPYLFDETGRYSDLKYITMKWGGVLTEIPSTPPTPPTPPTPAYTLFYSEGNTVYGAENDGTESTAGDYAPEATISKLSTATSFTINLTSPVGGNTVRWFTTNSTASKTWTVTQTGGTGTAGLVTAPTGTPTATVTSITATYGVLIPAGFGTGIVTLTIGSYIVTINVTADNGTDTVESAKTKAFAANVGETFKASGIEWRVLGKQSDEALIIAEHVLDTQSINDTNTDWDTTILWSSSELRTNLNNSTHSYSAGNLSFKDAILDTTLYTRKGWNGNTYNDPISITTDKVFLLSEEETLNSLYSGTPDFTQNIYPGTVLFADYHASKATIVSGKTASYWWLRSPSHRAINAARVIMSNGKYSSNVVESLNGVRPALRLDLTAPDVEPVAPGDPYWFYHDGYFYWSEPLAPGASTAPLLKSIFLKGETPNRLKNSDYTLTVNMEALQASKGALAQWGISSGDVFDLLNPKGSN
jgi:hypothetical protein